MATVLTFNAAHRRLMREMEKRRLKLLIYTSKPEAIARRAETERQAATWAPLAMPPPSDDFVPEVEPSEADLACATVA